jgi:4-diphosphocytidyl-2-C-methyl-D-erythritol kinase
MVCFFEGAAGDFLALVLVFAVEQEIPNFMPMIGFPNAKINIGLNILSKRADGYHNIETIFYPLDLCDILEFIPAERGQETQITVSGLVPDGTVKDNLVFQAYQVLSAEYPLTPLKIHLHKIIPSGAGLGGGSSDAAHMISLLARYFQLPISLEMQSNYASRLGSDCPYFLLNRPAMARGRGEILEPVELSLSGLYLVLVKPYFPVNTREAYAGIIPRTPGASLSELIRQPISSWNNLIINDFEKTIFRKYPEIGEIKSRLIRSGALFASMSGSGSSVYGIFREKPGKIDFPENYFLYSAQL